jgi:hypothetical protein
MAKHPKRPRDPNVLAKLIVDMATGEVPRDLEPKPETPLTEARRKGGLKGGKARAKKLGARKRKAIAREAARARWSNRTA